jgi:hypothetical protein
MPEQTLIDGQLDFSGGMNGISDALSLGEAQYRLLLNGEVIGGKPRTRRGIVYDCECPGSGTVRGSFIYTDMKNGNQSLFVFRGSRLFRMSFQYHEFDEIMIDPDERDAEGETGNVRFVQAQDSVFIMRGQGKSVLVWKDENFVRTVKYVKENTISEIGRNGDRLEFVLEKECSWRAGDIIMSTRETSGWDDLDTEAQEEYYDDDDKITEDHPEHKPEETDRAKANYAEYEKKQKDRELAIGEVRTDSIWRDGKLVTSQSLFFYDQAKAEEDYWFKGDVIELKDSGVIDRFPESSFGEYIGGRIWTVKDYDNIYASDILDPFSFDYAKQAFQVNKGDGGRINALVGFRNDSVLVFKDNSVYALSNIYDEIGRQTLSVVDGSFGAQGGQAVCHVGDEVFYFGRGGIRSLSLNEMGRTQLVQAALSDPVSNEMDGLDWTLSADCQMEYFGNCLLFAYSEHGASKNSRILIYNFMTRSWISKWTLPDFGGESGSTGVFRFLKHTENGVQKLSFMDFSGRIWRMLADLYEDEILSDRLSIPFRLETRAYSFRNPLLEKVLAKSEIGILHADPEVSMSGKAEKSIFEEVIMCSGKTYSSTAYDRHGIQAWQDDNRNNDANRPYRKNYAPFLMQRDPEDEDDGYFYLFDDLYIDVMQKHKIENDMRMHGTAFGFCVECHSGAVSVDSVQLTARMKTISRGE